MSNARKKEPIVYGNDPKEEHLKVSEPKLVDVKKVIFYSVVGVLVLSAIVYLLLMSF